MTETEIRQLKNERDYYKRAFQSARAQLDKLPKGSFIALQLERAKRDAREKNKSQYDMDIKMYIDDHSPVRLNNELTANFKALCETYTGGKCQYVEEGILRGDHRNESASYDARGLRIMGAIAKKVNNEK